MTFISQTSSFLNNLNFPTISDTPNEVGTFRLPAITGTPTSTPAYGGAGYLLFDTATKNVYVWIGSSWHNINNFGNTSNIDGGKADSNYGGIDPINGGGA